MTKTKAAETATATMRDRKAAALTRVTARRRPPQYKTIPGTGTDIVRIQLDNGGPFLEPETADQWADDRQARTPIGEPISDALFEAWELCREGSGSAPKAVSYLADKIRDPHQRFAVFMAINSVPAGPGGVGTALVKAWQRAGLPVMPQPMMPRESPNWNAPSEAARRVTYKTPLGNPA